MSPSPVLPYSCSVHDIGWLLVVGVADPRTRPLLVIKTQANVLNLVLIRVTNQGVLWPTKLWFLLLYISTSPHGAPDRHIQLLILMFLVFPWNLERDDCTLHGYEIIIFFQKHWKFVKVILSDQDLCFCAERKAVDVIVFHVNFVSASKYASPVSCVISTSYHMQIRPGKKWRVQSG